MARLMPCPSVLLAVLLLAASSLRADIEKSCEDGEAVQQADPIVGVWKLVKAAGAELPPGVDITAEFTADGKVRARMLIMGTKESRTGGFKVNGKKLTVTIEGQKPETETIKTLDDKRLVTVDAKGKETVFRKAR